MRKRGLTIYADTVEEYMSLALNPQDFDSFSPQSTSPQESTCREPAKSAKTDSFWDDFNFQTNDSQTCGFSLPSSIESADRSRISDADTDYTDSSPKKSRDQKIRRFMVMSSTTVEGHNLINSSFKSSMDTESLPMRQCLDLVVKRGNEEGRQYHFWLKALEDKRFDNLVKVYYKCASTFIFVYSTSDRKSFEMVEEAIREVLREVPREKFNGVLLGRSSEMEENPEVSYEEGVLLRQKYGLSLFEEINIIDESLKEKILNPFC